MYKRLSGVIALLLACAGVTGCGAMSAQSLMMKGAMWAGKEVVKKELKKRKGHQGGGEGGYVTHSRQGRPGHDRNSSQPKAATTAPSQR